MNNNDSDLFCILKYSWYMTITLLEVPFDKRYEARNAGAKYDAKMKVSYVEGEIKSDLKKWKSEDYSYARWVEDTINKKIRIVTPGPVVFKPREHQTAAQQAISKAWNEGMPGFLIADSTGLGKTLSIVAGVARIAKLKRKTPANKMKTLIVCPKGAIPVWRQTLKAYPESILLRPLIINYQQLNKLIKEPQKVKSGKDKRGRKISTRVRNRTIARDGVPKINFDVIVFDESHYLKNYGSSAMSMSAATLAKLNDPYVKNKSPFVIYSTATPGSSPMNMAIMAPTLSKLIRPTLRRHISPKDWGKFLYEEKFHVTKGKTGWSWITTPWYGSNSKDPKERKKYEMAKAKTKKAQDEDTVRIGKAWTRPNAPYLARDPSDVRGWPLQQVEPFYIELAPEELQAYEEAWGEFRAYLKLKQKGQADPKDGLTKRLRFRQKASLLKIPMIAEHTEELLANDKQVFIGCQFLETVDKLEEIFRKKKIKYAEVSGRSADKQAERIRFQKGEAKVVLCTVTEAISCHAGESLPDGTKATENDRVTIIADVRENPNDCIQQMGRCHREGKHSLCEFPLIVGTVDEKVMMSFVDKARNLKNMKGEPDPEYLDKVFMEIM